MGLLVEAALLASLLGGYQVILDLGFLLGQSRLLPLDMLRGVLRECGCGHQGQRCQRRQE
jgi:hypothetical protein